MEFLRHQIRTGWRAEAAVLVCAALLAFGTLASMEMVHVRVLGEALTAGGSHFLRDGLLLLPLGLAAAWWGVRPGAGLTRAATRTATAFAVLLAPGAAAHTWLHTADAAGVAHAGVSRGTVVLGAAQERHGLASAVLHGATDALLALPIAFLLSLAAVALVRARPGRAAPATAPRRWSVLAASTLAVVAAVAIVPVSGAASPDYPKFSMPLKIPPVLTGQDIKIDMAETEQQLLPGSPTRMWTYNGTFPGPIIRRPSGVPTNVTFTNSLPASAGSMSVHHHGTHSPQQDDGQPASYLIPPGTSKTYNYPGVEDGAPERAAPQWYHDHRDMVTGRNVWMGLLGAFIYDDPFEAALNLPKGAYDVPLMVTDRTFDANNQIPYTFVSSGTFGDVIIVNGVPQPFYEVGDRRYRFRLYNVSNRRDYTFRLSNGQAMTQIGTDSGLLPAPVSRTSIRLGPAERADVVIDFSGRLNENIVLQNSDADFGPGDRDGEVMQFRVTKDVTDDSSPVPATLRPVPDIDPPVTTRAWVFDRTDGKWTINGKVFDPARVDAKPVLGTTERWIFRNPSPLPHIAHVHMGDQKLVSRNGQPPSPGERVKDSWYLAPGDEVVVDIKFTDYVGKFIFHCHVLEHEDDSMMTQFETVAGPGPITQNGGPIRFPGSPPPGAASGTNRTPARALSRQVKILSSKRLSRILRRGLRFEAALPVSGATLRARLTVRGRTIADVRRRALSRGRVRVTVRLASAGRSRLRRLLTGRRSATARLTVTAGAAPRSARFTIRR